MNARPIVVILPKAVFFALLALPLAGSVSDPAEASVLPQIEQARELEASGLGSGSASRPALSKHYVEVEPGVWIAVKGRRERRQIRIARWIDGLQGERRTVYEKYGFPTYRHFENGMGVRTEHWTYPRTDKTFVFRDGRLVRVENY